MQEAEPSMVHEDDFERAIIQHIVALPALQNGGILRHFGLDVAVLCPTGFKFLECKVYSGASGRIGFGNGAGEGPQVDLLLFSPEALGRLNTSVRWLFADLTRPVATPRFAVLTATEAKAAAAGQVSKGKQNNFNPRRVFAAPLAWGELLQTLAVFLTDDHG